MAARQPSASFADRDASRSHRSMMTERDEGTDGRTTPNNPPTAANDMPEAYIRVALFRGSNNRL